MFFFLTFANSVEEISSTFHPNMRPMNYLNRITSMSLAVSAALLLNSCDSGDSDEVSDVKAQRDVELNFVPQEVNAGDVFEVRDSSDSLIFRTTILSDQYASIESFDPDVSTSFIEYSFDASSDGVASLNFVSYPYLDDDIEDAVNTKGSDLAAAFASGGSIMLDALNDSFGDDGTVFAFNIGGYSGGSYDGTITGIYLVRSFGISFSATQGSVFGIGGPVLGYTGKVATTEDPGTANIIFLEPVEYGAKPEQTGKYSQYLAYDTHSYEVVEVIAIPYED